MIKRRQVAVAIVAALVAPAGLAWASTAPWAASGHGSGNAQVSVGAALAAGTVSGTAAITNKISPNKNGDLEVTMSNPNPFPVLITGVTFGNPTVATGCTTPALSWNGGTAPTWSTLSVPAKAGSANGTASETFANAVSMGSSSNDCQGATISISISNITGTADNAHIG